MPGDPGKIKKNADDKQRSATPVRVNGRSRGHFGVKAPPSNAVLLQYSPPDVARRTAIALTEMKVQSLSIDSDEKL